MSHGIRYLLEAREEVRSSSRWYDNQLRGLGRTFMARVRDALMKIEANPHRNPKIYHDVRKLKVAKFPFVIFYQVDQDENLIVSVFH